jgi:hypothetical protein
MRATVLEEGGKPPALQGRPSSRADFLKSSACSISNLPKRRDKPP